MADFFGGLGGSSGGGASLDNARWTYYPSASINGSKSAHVYNYLSSDYQLHFTPETFAMKGAKCNPVSV